MAVAFWTVVLKKDEMVLVDVPEGFVLNIQHATLQSGSIARVSARTENCDGEMVEPLLCTLRKETCDQCGLQLVFGDTDQPTTLTVQGSGDPIVHLMGYFQPGPGDFGSDDEDSDESYGDMDFNPSEDFLVESESEDSSDGSDDRE